MEILLVTLACLFAIGISLSRRSAHMLDAAGRAAAGRQGESRVGEILDMSGGQDRLDGIVIASARKRAQIDHLVRGEGLLVVVETKNWNGTLEGASDQDFWSLRRPDGRVSRMRNPLSQAERQARILASSTGGLVPIARLVVMAGRIKPAAASFPEGVVLLRELPATLPAMLAGGQGDPEAVSRAWTGLVDEAFSDDATWKAARYMEFVQSRFGEKPWHSWLVVAFSLAALSWTMALCLKALQMQADGSMM